MQYTITISDELVPGISAARAAYNAGLPPTENGLPVGYLDTDTAYVQYVMESAAGSYSRQYVYQPPGNVTAPVISTMTATQGTPITCTSGSWIGDPAPTYKYQWTRNGANIRNGINAEWTTLPADVGKTLRCIVTASNGIGSPRPIPSSNECVVS